MDSSNKKNKANKRNKSVKKNTVRRKNYIDVSVLLEKSKFKTPNEEDNNIIIEKDKKLALTEPVYPNLVRNSMPPTSNQLPEVTQNRRTSELGIIIPPNLLKNKLEKLKNKKKEIKTHVVKYKAFDFKDKNFIAIRNLLIKEDTEKLEKVISSAFKFLNRDKIKNDEIQKMEVRFAPGMFLTNNFNKNFSHIVDKQKINSIKKEGLSKLERIKDSAIAQIQLNEIQIKNSHKKMFRERILRIMLSAAAHLTRLGITSREFFDEMQELNVDSNQNTNDFQNLILAIKINDHDTILDLVAHNKFLLQMFDSFKQTALHIAAKRDRSKILKYLLNQGAKIDAEDETGKSALHNACKYNQVENVKVLLYEFATPFKNDHYGKMPIDYTTDNVIKFFIERYKSLFHLNLGINMNVSIKRIRTGLKYFFEMSDDKIRSYLSE